MDRPVTMLRNRVLQAVSGGLDALDGLGLPALALDEADRTLRWNREFIELFPEHDGHIHVGEPYEENLRRFSRARLDREELKHIERYVAEGVDRHRLQEAPFEFLHRGHWIRVEVLRLPGIGSLRFWQPVDALRDGDALAASMAVTGGQVGNETIDQLADGLIVRDAQGRILRANRRFAETYRLASTADAIGRTFPDILDIACPLPADNEEARRCWSGNSRFLGAPFELPLPGDRWVRVREHRTHDGALIGTHVDVTNLYRLQRSASAARIRAEELAAMLAREMEERKRTEAQLIQSARMVSLGQMATGLAHELNQPLAIMALAADAAMMSLQRSGADAIPEVLQRLEKIATTTIRASGIVDHLRLFGQQGEGETMLEALDLREIVESALVLTKAAIRSAGIALDVALPAEGLRVMGQRVALEQVVMGLLLNAYDAVTARKMPDGAIGLSIEDLGGQAMLAVSDNGGGFSASALEHALEPFFTTKEVGKGMGLGLSHAHATISAIGGTIAIGNRAGGAVVRVTQPVLGRGAAIPA